MVEIKGGMPQRKELKLAAMELQQRADGRSRLQDRIRCFRHGLVTLDERTTRAGRDVATIDDFEERISAVRSLQQELADRRLELVDVNFDVHRHVTSGGHSSLQEDVATLYRVWDEVNHRAQAQLEHLSDAAATWWEFEAERAALAAALEADRRRLGLLQQTLTTNGGGDRSQTTVTGGDVTGATDVTGTDGARSRVIGNGVTDDPGGTIGEVQRLIYRHPNPTSSKQEDIRQRGSSPAPDHRAAAESADLSRLSQLTSPGHDDLSEGTSGYDSACSDELSEMERRLGRLLCMSSDLETLLSPAGQAWSDVTTTLSTATSELRELQRSCRQLVVRTTAQLPLDGGGGDGGGGGGGGGGGRRQRASPVLRRNSCCAASRCDSAPLSPQGWTGWTGWARRVLRAALPFQLAMLLWLSSAYLLDPGCCDDLNYLASSLTSQLSYVSGPPPI